MVGSFVASLVGALVGALVGSFVASFVASFVGALVVASSHVCCEYSFESEPLRADQTWTLLHTRRDCLGSYTIRPVVPSFDRSSSPIPKMISNRWNL